MTINEHSAAASSPAHRRKDQDLVTILERCLHLIFKECDITAIHHQANIGEQLAPRVKQLGSQRLAIGLNHSNEYILYCASLLRGEVDVSSPEDLF